MSLIRGTNRLGISQKYPKSSLMLFPVFAVQEASATDCIMSATVGIQWSQEEQPSTPTRITGASSSSLVQRDSPDKASQRLLQFTSFDTKSPLNPLESLSFTQSPVRPKPTFLLSGTSRSAKTALGFRPPQPLPELPSEHTAVQAYRAIRSLSSVPSSIPAFRSGRNVLNRLVVRLRKENKARSDLRAIRRKVTEVRLDFVSHQHTRHHSTGKASKLPSEAPVSSHIRRKSASKRPSQARLSVLTLDPPGTSCASGWSASDLTALLSIPYQRLR